MPRRRLPLTVLAILGVGAVFAQAGSTARGQEAGIFRISFAPQVGFDHVDPALAFTQPAWALLDTVCARLMTHPDKGTPKAFELVPEVATGQPRVSDDFKTFTFALRKGFRFSDGTPLRASAFAHAINRTLAPGVNSPGVLFTRDIVGAADVLAGRAKTAKGVVARGNRLVVRLTRPTPDFAARTSLPFFCAVPPGLPADAEGMGAFDSAGPFYVSEYRPGERVEIRRNRYYGGSRPQRVDGFDVDLRAPSPADMIRRIDRGEADWGYAVSLAFMDSTLGIVDKHGVNRSRFFMQPGLTLRMLAFNSSRPLFKNNPKLRRAVNFALDRQALLPLAGGPVASTLTDQHLPPALPGYKNAGIYPLANPDLSRASALTNGNLRGGKAIFYTPDSPPTRAIAQLVTQQLAAIGLAVEVRPIPIHTASAAYLSKLATRGEQWDIALMVWSPNLADPYSYINLLLDTTFLSGSSLTGFQARGYRLQMQQAARLLDPKKRLRAYGELDADLARDAAPVAALTIANEATFVSERVGCITLRPMLDLATVCLKR